MYDKLIESSVTILLWISALLKVVRRNALDNILILIVGALSAELFLVSALFIKLCVGENILYLISVGTNYR